VDLRIAHAHGIPSLESLPHLLQLAEEVVVLVELDFDFDFVLVQVHRMSDGGKLEVLVEDSVLCRS
jgi:hypothetical protein